tara:strand:- start:12691 stop:12972 length:282 start_codon:yes stop_codon:yes gene_type:complete
MNKEEMRDQVLARDLEAEQQAIIVTSNPEYQGAILSYKAKLFDAFISSADDEQERREGIYRQSKCIRVVEQNLAKLMNSGKLARNTLKLNEDV